MSIPRLVQAANGRYYVHWTEGRRSQRRALRTSNLTEAKKQFSEWLVKEDKRKKRVSYTIGEMWDVYERQHVAKTASPETSFISWNAMRSHFEKLSVEDVTEAVRSYTKIRSKIAAPSTIRRELGALRACLNWCASGRACAPMIDRVPFIALPPASAPRDRWLSDAELRTFRDAAADLGGPGHLFVELAIETAGRRQVLMDLTWDRVDFDTKVIHLHEAGKAVTSKRAASVPISDRLMPVLLANKGTGRVFPRDFGGYHFVKLAARRAGIEDVSPHVLRHTAATHMARRGVPLWVIAKVLGNTVAVVERTYAKHSPEDLREAINLISGGN